MSELSISPCVRVPRVLESSADKYSQNILTLYWNNAKKNFKSSSSSFLQQRCWVPCCLFLICSTIFWGDVVLPSKYTEFSAKDPHGALLATVKAGWEKNCDRSYFPLERDISRQNISWERVTLSKIVTEKCQAVTIARKTYFVPSFSSCSVPTCFCPAHIYIWVEGGTCIEIFYGIFTLLYLIVQ